MSWYIDVAYDRINKKGEELCGDNVEIIKLKDYTILVLADGLGSGVKANILATMTSKIAGTMLKEGVDIYETVDTLTNTLPVCKVRNIAYATFTIIKIYNDGKVEVFEYDNPPIFFIRKGKFVELSKKELEINGKIVKQSNFHLKNNDALVVVSDGAIHAGIGNLLNLGWTWECVKEFLEKISPSKKNADNITKELISVCWELYGGKPGDDTTALAVKLRKAELVTIFTGPPENENNDKIIIEELINSEGKKVICGGTAGNIAQRELRRPLEVDISSLDGEVPPTAVLEGIDLVTEGVLTLSRAIDMMKNYSDYSKESFEKFKFDGNDGASRLCKILLEECTHVELLVGKAVNPAHQNPDFPQHLSIKLHIINDMCNLLKKFGKEVNIKYFD